MNRRPLKFITRQKEWELIQRLTTIVDNSKFTPQDTAVLMVSPDYSSTVAMHLAHSWSVGGEMLPVIPVDVTYPGEDTQTYRNKFRYDFHWHHSTSKLKHLVLVEAGIIRGGNWAWLLEELHGFNFSRDQITLVAMCENVNSAVKSDYVGEYYDDSKQELMFYYERFNKNWPVY